MGQDAVAFIWQYLTRNYSLWLYYYFDERITFADNVGRITQSKPVHVVTPLIHVVLRNKGARENFRGGYDVQNLDHSLAVGTIYVSWYSEIAIETRLQQTVNFRSLCVDEKSHMP